MAGDPASREGATDRRCRGCGGATRWSLNVCAAGEVLAGRPPEETFDYDCCEECGALQIRRWPKDLGRYYGADYYTRAHAHPGVASKSIRRAWSRMRLREGHLIRLLSGRRYARFDWFRKARVGLGDPILDVGCGSGRLLQRMAREGFLDLVGIDAHWPGDPLRSASLRIERDRPETHRGRYRLVMAHHSFEHMEDPVAALNALARLVEPSGVLLLRVPIAGSYACERYGADWAQLDPPRHLFLPTRSSIERLAKSAGLRVLEVVDDSGPFQIRGSERLRIRAGQSGLGDAWRSRLKSSLGARPIAWWLRKRGLGDQACFYLEHARPPEDTPT